MELKTSRRGIVSALWTKAAARVTGLAGALVVAGAASAQPCDGQFQTGNGIPGISGNGNVITSWDPDGAGPTPELLYAGGRYKLAHTTLVNSLGSWEPLFNAQNPVGIWRNVAGGVTGAGGALGTVNVMFPIGTEMLVGGEFTTAGGVAARNVVKFDGLTNTWIPYGTGVNGPVFCSTIFNGQLFIGGVFQITPGIPSQDSVARWDGARWQGVGPGFQLLDPMDVPPSTPKRTIPGPVYSLAVFNNRLYAGGAFLFSGRNPPPPVGDLEPIECPHFAVWNPQTQRWNRMLTQELTAPFPYSPVIRTMRTFGNALYLGGIWDNYGASFAVSNGVSELVGGVVAPVNGGVYKFFDWSKVYSLGQVGNELMVGGDFEFAGAAGSKYAFNVVRWTGATYLAVADGGSEGPVESVTSHRGQLAIMGALEVVNGQRVRGISWYNGNMWTRAGLGMDGPITAMGKYNNQIVAGGRFGRTSTDVMALGVATFNGTTWSQVGQGLSLGRRGTLPLPPPAVQPSRPLQPPIINDLTTHDGDLIAVGEFSQSGITPGFANIAKWNGAVWSPVGQVDGPVFGAASYRGQLFIAGDLVNYGNVCQYDGFGGYVATTFGTDAAGLTLTVHNDNLVAGGLFGFAGGVQTGVVAKWNYDTETWSKISQTQTTFTPPPANPPIPPQCNVVTVIDGDLYAGGNWININGNVNLRKFCRFNSATGLWVPVGPNGTGPNYDVFAITKVGNSIYVGGNSGTNLMAFDGTVWRTVDGGTDGPVFGIEELNGRVWVGGNFLTASNEPSSYFTSYIADQAVSINSSPASATVCEGGSVTLSVSAAGTPPLAYQWKRNGVNVGGATAPTLNLNPAVPGNSGNYTCFVSNGCSNATSGAAAVVVNSLAAITTHPVNRTLCAGAALNLSVVATGSPTLTYQWRLNDVAIPNATASTYNVANSAGANAGVYTCAVTNPCNTVVSNPATVVVNQPVAITVQPQGSSLCAGSPLSLSVTATGTGPISYQWRLGANNISGATSDTYSVPSASGANAGTYSCVVTNSCNSVTSANAVVTVTEGVAITAQPQNAEGCDGGSVAFSVTATGTSPTYQWQFNGGNIDGATASTYTINPFNAGSVGSYTCVVSNSCGSVVSNAATAAINQPVAITVQPQGSSLCAGSPLSLSVTATGTGPISYQWRLGANNISGATSDTYSVPSASGANAGTYSCVVTNSCNSVTSANAVVTVTEGVAITAQPQNAEGCDGGSVAFSVTATGTSPTYQWQFNGGNIDGATASTYTINPINAGSVGSYSCVVSNSCGSVTSDAATFALVTICCPADFNRDDFVDFFDYLDFVTAFENGLPGGDFNNDGFIDFFDYLDFTTAFEIGC